MLDFIQPRLSFAGSSLSLCSFQCVLVSLQSLSVLCFRGEAFGEHFLDFVRRVDVPHFGRYQIVLDGQFVAPNVVFYISQSMSCFWMALNCGVLPVEDALLLVVLDTTPVVVHKLNPSCTDGPLASAPSADCRASGGWDPATASRKILGGSVEVVETEDREFSSRERQRGGSTEEIEREAIVLRQGLIIRLRCRELYRLATEVPVELALFSNGNMTQAVNYFRQRIVIVNTGC